MANIIGTIYGWLGDIVGTHVFLDGVPKALRRRWNLSGFTVTDDPSNEWLDISPTGGSGTPYDSDPSEVASGEGGPGVSASYARGDHVHSHGNRSGGTLHAAAIASGAAGFMSGSDKAKLDGIAAGATAYALADNTIAPSRLTNQTGPIVIGRTAGTSGAVATVPISGIASPTGVAGTDTNNDATLRRVNLTDRINASAGLLVDVAGEAVTVDADYPIELKAGSASGGQNGLARTKLVAEVDGTHHRWFYDTDQGADFLVTGARAEWYIPSASHWSVFHNSIQRLKIDALGFAGGRGTASGTGSFCFGDVLCVANGDASFCAGYDNTAGGTYCVTLGAYNRNAGTAGVCIGENLAIASTSANGTALGYANSIADNSPYATVIGNNCYVEANCPGGYAVGCSSTVTRPGQYRWAPGITFHGGFNILGLAREANAAAANLVDRLGNEFVPEQYSIVAAVLDWQAATHNGDKYAVGQKRFNVRNVSGGVITLGSIVDGDTEGMAENGWTMTVTDAGSGVVRMSFDPGPDRVQITATLTWRQLGGTSSIPT